jgi:hypothetical protein
MTTSVKRLHTYLTVEQLRARKQKRKPQIGVVRQATIKYEAGSLPLWGSVKQYCPTPFDQGQLGSCTSNSFCGSYMTLSNKLKTADAGWVPSRLWFYYWERVVENPGQNPQKLGDTGGDVVDGMGYVQKNGICSDTLWPYNIAIDDQKPTTAMTSDAAKHKIKSYYTIPINSALISTLESVVSSGSPVCIAIAVYNSFESQQCASSGMVPLPTPTNYNDPNDPIDPYLGGHEILIVGYNHEKQLFTVLNSWGADWGDKGYCYIPYAYITNPQLGMEFTVIEL